MLITRQAGRGLRAAAVAVAVATAATASRRRGVKDFMGRLASLPVLLWNRKNDYRDWPAAVLRAEASSAR